MGILSPVTERAVQCKVLLKKNLLLHIRNWKTTAICLLSPLVFIIILFGLQKLYVYEVGRINENPVATPIGDIPRCTSWNKTRECITLLYSPNNDPMINGIMQILADSNSPQFSMGTSLDQKVDIISMPTQEALTDFILQNPNITQSAIVFGYDPLDKSVLIYDVLYNSTLGAPDVKVEIIHALNKAIMKQQVDFPTDIQVASHGFPPVIPGFAGGTVVSMAGAFWFYCPPMFSFIILLNQVVTEKELKLRLGMKMMGLKDSMFWLSWFITSAVINMLSALILIGSGWAFRFDVFVNTNFIVQFVMFFLFSIAMIPLAFLASAFIQKSQTANTIGFVIFVIGLFLQILFTSFAIYFWYLPTTKPVFRKIFMFYPPFNFAKIFADVSQFASDKFDANGNLVSAAGYSLSDLTKSVFVEYFNVDSPPAIDSIGYLFMNTAIFAVLAWYFDNVLIGENGTPRPIYFFLTPEYWGFGFITRALRRRFNKAERAPLLGGVADKDIDEDVANECQRTLETDDDDERVAVKIVNLHKIYRKFPLIRTSKDHYAVQDLYLTIDRGQLFCLLGHNGAGKTTTINILTGLFKPDKGDAFIYGYSARHDIDSIRKILGVCPQHDILWNQLTAREHLEIFAEFKGIPRKSIKKAIDDKLEEIGLAHVKNHQAGTFSGGMKRRLSVGISSIGDPKVIYFDEPTTGLDPISKRKVWDLIQKLKKDRAIILTTHSMEEADLLSDKIGIMAYSKLRCIGDSLHLKTKFGHGYHINLIVDVASVEEVKELVANKLTGARLVNDNAGSLHYVVNSRLDQIPAFFETYVENPANNKTKDGARQLIRDWTLSLTTLEEVFLKITNDAHQQFRDRDSYHHHHNNNAKKNK